MQPVGIFHSCLVFQVIVGLFELLLETKHLSQNLQCSIWHKSKDQTTDIFIIPPATMESQDLFLYIIIKHIKQALSQLYWLSLRDLSSSCAMIMHQRCLFLLQRWVGLFPLHWLFNRSCIFTKLTEDTFSTDRFRFLS